MKTFLQETIGHIQAEQKNFLHSVWIVPSKRAAGFIKNEFRKQAERTQILPTIYSVEEFISKLSGLQIIEPTQMIFECYEAYLKVDNIENKEDFDTFSTWVSTLIGDFNEIDRYLLDTTSFFNYLKDIQDIDHWYLAEERTEWILNYLNFWNSLSELYDILTHNLLKKKIAYQGLVYRKAAENVKTYIETQIDKNFVFIGFNALNNAEQQIFQTFLEDPKHKVYWDMDAHFLEDKQHGASLFLRRYIETWKYFENHSPIGVQRNFAKHKEIQILQAPQNTTQVKALGSILEELNIEERKKTAIVLADESLLQMVLGSLPDCVEKVNVTMGATIEHFPIVLFFTKLFEIHQKKQSTYYHKDIFSILQHPFIQNNLDGVRSLLNELIQQNLSYCDLNKLKEIYTGKDVQLLELLFTPWYDDTQNAIQTCLRLTRLWLEKSKKTNIKRVVLFELYKLLEKLQEWMENYPHIKTTKTLSHLFAEAIRTTNIDFEGDAYDGLQIMGVLESRLLDFENVILLSVNEGVLPSGKSNNSFITYDLKKEYGLPLYTEKDAIYTYHFYRLLQRAKKVWLSYHTDNSGYKGGEPSRFITQLQIDKLPNHQLSVRKISPNISNSRQIELQSISKNTQILERLDEIRLKGFSPSTLTLYIRNPLDFYEKRILGIDEADKVEEDLATNTLGTIVHHTLENLYKQCNAILDIESLERIQKLVGSELEQQFKNEFKNGDYTKGLNLIIYDVAKQFVHRTIALDLSLLKSREHIEIIQLEQKLEGELFLPKLNKTVKIYGLADRIERFNGQLRIVDYKTGAVGDSELAVTDWSALIEKTDKSKAFQVLTYAWLYMQNTEVDELESGVISMRKMSRGFDAVRGGRGNSEWFGSLITREIVMRFEKCLVDLIEEIFNLEIDFIEK